MNRDVWKQQPTSALIDDAMEYYGRGGEVTGVAAGQDKAGWYLRVWFAPGKEPMDLRRWFERGAQPDQIPLGEFEEYRVEFRRGYFVAHAS